HGRRTFLRDCSRGVCRRAHREASGNAPRRACGVCDHVESVAVRRIDTYSLRRLRDRYLGDGRRLAGERTFIHAARRQLTSRTTGCPWHNAALPSLCFQLEATPMNSDDITRKQATEINQALRPTLGYLYRLRERMIKKGFLPSDS